MIGAKLEGVNELRKRLDAYGKEVNKSASEVIQDMANLGGRNLANYTFPKGITNKVRDTLYKSIFKDVNRAYGTEAMIYKAIAKSDKRLAEKYAVLSIAGKNAEAAQLAARVVDGFQGLADNESGSHLESVRNQKGRVPRYQQKQITQADYEQIKATKVLKAGLVKTAWLQAVENIGKKVRIPVWLRKAQPLGRSILDGEGMETSVTLINSVKYAHRLTPANIVQRAVGNTYRGFVKFINKKLAAAAKRV